MEQFVGQMESIVTAEVAEWRNQLLRGDTAVSLQETVRRTVEQALKEPPKGQPAHDGNGSATS